MYGGYINKAVPVHQLRSNKNSLHSLTFVSFAETSTSIDIGAWGLGSDEDRKCKPKLVRAVC